MFREKKDSRSFCCLLGEGIFTMGYSKNYIMYWGVFTGIIIACAYKKVCTNIPKFSTSFCANCVESVDFRTNLHLFLQHIRRFLLPAGNVPRLKIV